MKDNSENTAAQELEDKRQQYLRVRKRVIVVPISPELLFKLLDIPKDIDYAGGYYDFDSDTFRIRLRGERFAEVGEGMRAPTALVSVSMNEDKTINYRFWNPNTDFHTLICNVPAQSNPSASSNDAEGGE